MTEEKAGTLYVVATPIGNLGDMTLRAIETLREVDRIAAEDTRQASKLLNHYSIKKPIFSLHQFNEQARIDAILKYLKTGESIALISDAGTPLISDPGYHLVGKIRAEHLNVVPIPGASSVVTALSVSGLPSDRFVFEGFLPARDESRRQHLNKLKHESRTLIFFEAPHRLLKSLDDMAFIFGRTRQAIIARELTKIHESIIGNTLGEVQDYFKTHADELRGEIVILLAGDKEPEQMNEEKSRQLLTLLLAELPFKKAVLLAQKISGLKKNYLYDLALTLKSI